MIKDYEQSLYFDYRENYWEQYNKRITEPVRRLVYPQAKRINPKKW